ncbi:MAG: hypothetical protein U0736_01380 [Gemmataceae bacterium]
MTVHLVGIRRASNRNGGTRPASAAAGTLNAASAGSHGISHG